MSFITLYLTVLFMYRERERGLLQCKSDGFYYENDDEYPRFYQKRNQPAVTAVITIGERGKAARHILHKWLNDSAAAAVIRGGGESDRAARRRGRRS